MLFLTGIFAAHMLKDYYEILEVPPHATLQEIKQAYRRLAMIYHPDKSGNDPYAETKFNSIKEAYEVMTNPARKEAYLQDRWYNQSIGKKRTVQPITPVSILKLALELEKYVSKLDRHRMNQEGLFNYVNELVSTDTIGKLRQHNETGINRQIITTILMTTKPLQLQFAKTISVRLEQLAGNDEESLERIDRFLQLHKKNFLWNKYQLPIILIIAALICLLIYLTS